MPSMPMTSLPAALTFSSSPPSEVSALAVSAAAVVSAAVPDASPPQPVSAAVVSVKASKMCIRDSLKGQHRTEAPRLPLHQGVAGVFRQAGVDDPRDLRLELEPFGQRQRVFLGAIHPHSESLDAPQQQPRVKGCQIRADGLADLPQAGGEGGVLDDRKARQRVIEMCIRDRYGFQTGRVPASAPAGFRRCSWYRPWCRTRRSRSSDRRTAPPQHPELRFRCV